MRREAETGAGIRGRALVQGWGFPKGTGEGPGSWEVPHPIEMPHICGGLQSKHFSGPLAHQLLIPKGGTGYKFCLSAVIF